MRKIVIGFSVLLTGFVSLYFLMDCQAQIVLAKTDENEAVRKWEEHDKRIPQEKVERALGEANKIKEDILQTIAKQKSKYRLTYFSRPLNYHTPGQKGVTRTELGWKQSSNDLYMVVTLDYDKEDVKQKFDRGMKMIQMGDFFALPKIGDEAILVKNVTANKRMTDVGIHFLKGRAQVDIYFTNHFQTTAKNEKELMEFVKLIEPLIIARPSFYD